MMYYASHILIPSMLWFIKKTLNLHCFDFISTNIYSKHFVKKIIEILILNNTFYHTKYFVCFCLPYLVLLAQLYIYIVLRHLVQRLCESTLTSRGWSQ